MKKKSSIIGLLATIAVLQGCAETVSPQKKSSQTVISGSEKLYLSSKECPRGIAIVRLYSDTLDGRKTKFNAKVGITTKPIETEMNVYSLVNESTITDGFSKGGHKGPPAKKPEIDTSLNSIEFTLLDKPAEDGKAATGDIAEFNKPLAIRFDPKLGFYHNWGEAPSVALGPNKNNMKVVSALRMSLDGNSEEQAYNFPETIQISDDAAASNIAAANAPADDGAAKDKTDSDAAAAPKEGPHKFYKKYPAEVGKPLTIDVNPKKIAGTGTLWAQLIPPGKGGVISGSYFFLKKEEAGVPKLEIPTKDVKPGTYAMNVFRSQVEKVPVDNSNYCLELTTGFMGLAEISKAPDAPKK